MSDRDFDMLFDDVEEEEEYENENNESFNLELEDSSYHAKLDNFAVSDRADGKGSLLMYESVDDI